MSARRLAYRIVLVMAVIKIDDNDGADDVVGDDDEDGDEDDT